MTAHSAGVSATGIIPGRQVISARVLRHSRMYSAWQGLQYRWPGFRGRRPHREQGFCPFTAMDTRETTIVTGQAPFLVYP